MLIPNFRQYALFPRALVERRHACLGAEAGESAAERLRFQRPDDLHQLGKVAKPPAAMARNPASPSQGCVTEPITNSRPGVLARVPTIRFSD